ncbi:beta-ketoacyl synthase [Streptomyces sp. Wb2n-11]|uniref:beta-ketoacyl-[acyl-carrier-protein] synthase family protein n=1 Tax=Streptomyces sp. Wb2n-11 TaxID=1030533 RepID=UPI000B8367EA|nr:beta-ketoacyl-[acyl-carrier-protein] synthase family protein [Streptomyces sp. Wb2n-11]
MSDQRVAVTGLGLVTPAGDSPQAVWETLCAGRSLAARDPALAGLSVDFSCQVSGFDAVTELGVRMSRRLDRFAHLGLAAARRAVRDAGLAPHEWAAERVGVVLGVSSNSLQTYAQEFSQLGGGRPSAVSPLALARSIPSQLAGEVAIDLGARGPNFVTTSACASSMTAIGVARDLIRAGTCDIVLTGGGESPRAPMNVACLTQMKALSRECPAGPGSASRPFDVDRGGLVLGEGAAVLALESAAHARARGARVRAFVRGYGASADAYHPIAPHPGGRGAEQALRSALADAGCAPADVDHVSAHGTGTRRGDAVEADVLLRVFGTPPVVTAAKSVVGHAMGAAGALATAFTLLAMEHQAVPPTANLAEQEAGRELDIPTGRHRRLPVGTAVVNAFGFGGQNAVLLLTAP